MRNSLLIFALPLLAASVCAQTPGPAPVKPELPVGPLLKSAGDFAQWEVTFVYADELAKKDHASGPPKPVVSGADERPRKTTTTKTGRIVHEEMVDLLNRTTDKWYSGTAQYTRKSNNSTWSQAEAGLMGDQGYNPLPANGFRNLDWIRPENYAGTIQYGAGRQCLIFTPEGYEKLDLSNPEERDKRLAAAESVAYVDADERLPVVVRTHSETRTYHFLTPPTQMQALPADLSEQIKKGEEARARLFQPAPRPR